MVVLGQVGHWCVGGACVELGCVLVLCSGRGGCVWGRFVDRLAHMLSLPHPVGSPAFRSLGLSCSHSSLPWWILVLGILRDTAGSCWTHALSLGSRTTVFRDMSLSCGLDCHILGIPFWLCTPLLRGLRVPFFNMSFAVLDMPS
jgi:hypothetical protein